MIPTYTRWSNSEAFWIRTRTPVSDQLEPLVVVGISDGPFDDTLETVHDLPERVVRCGTCPAELPELNEVQVSICCCPAKMSVWSVGYGCGFP